MKTLVASSVWLSISPAANAKNIIPYINVNFLKPKKPLPEQWWSGPIMGPSPAYPHHAGGFRPEFFGSLPAGRFNSDGDLVQGNSTKIFNQTEWFKQGITDRLSIKLKPTWGVATGGHNSRGSHTEFEDLPIDFQYRLSKAYTPSLDMDFGVKIPTGKYNNLSSPLTGINGSGTVDIRYGMILQFVRPFFHRQLRIRIYGEGRTPLNSAKLKNITSYNTPVGFSGKANVGPYGDEGISFEWGITRQFVFSLDLYSTWASATKVNGYTSNGTALHKRGGWQSTYNIGPQVSYMIGQNLSLNAEVIVMAAGHNAQRNITPVFSVFRNW